MTTPVTEQLHQEAIGLDARPLTEVAYLLARSQSDAAAAPLASLPSICAGAKEMAQTIRSGGVLHYLAAGSSGLMAAADALELGGTFSIPASQIRIHMAGGLPSGVEMPGDTEDATGTLAHDLADLSPKDTLITVSASGSTPYTVAAARIAREQRCDDHRDCKQRRHRPTTVIRPLDSACHTARTDFGLDPHGRGHGAENRAEHAVYADGGRVGAYSGRHDDQSAC